VADVKEHRLNAKREHLRARIGVVLGFQAYLGAVCEMIGTLTRRLSRNNRFMRFWRRLNLIPLKYHFNDLEIRFQQINIPHNLNPSFFFPMATRKGERLALPRPTSSVATSSAGLLEQVTTETGYYYHRDTTRDRSLFNEEESTRLLRRTDEIRDLIEDVNTRTNNELRKMATGLQSELEDIKRRLTDR
jgi:hypothetical protein